MSFNRRQFLRRSSTLAAAGIVFPMLDRGLLGEIRQEFHSLRNESPEVVAGNNDVWEEVRKAFEPDPSFINLENGYYSPNPTVVIEKWLEKAREINRKTSFYMRREMNEEKEVVRMKLAEFAGADPETIALVRNTTEALDILIAGIDLEPGDEVIITHQDYGSMVEAFKQQERRYKVKLKQISLPVPPKSKEDLIAPFRNAITDRTKVMLVTHMINLNGTVLPAKELIELGNQKGIKVIVDAAHSFAHLDFKISDLGCSFLGTSLHKWLCAPLGNGMLYVDKKEIEGVWPLLGDVGKEVTDIRKLEHTGTRPPATYLGILDAIEFHNGIGSKNKEARLRMLKNRWAEAVKDIDKVILNTSIDKDLSCAIANVAVEGMSPAELSRKLLDDHNIWTVAINSTEIKGVRITPHLYNTTDDVDKLAEALKKIAS